MRDNKLIKREIKFKIIKGWLSQEIIFYMKNILRHFPFSYCDGRQVVDNGASGLTGVCWDAIGRFYKVFLDIMWEW